MKILEYIAPTVMVDSVSAMLGGYIATRPKYFMFLELLPATCCWKRHDLPKDIFLRYDIWKQGVLYSWALKKKNVLHSMKSWLVNNGMIVMVYYIFFHYYADTTQFHNSLHPYITQISAKFFLAVCWKGNDLKRARGYLKYLFSKSRMASDLEFLLASYMRILFL